DKLFHAASLRCDGRISDSEERIEHRLHARDTMQLDAPFGQLHGKCRRMWSLFHAALNGLIRNGPGVAPASQIASACMPPECNVAFVLIRNPQGEPVDFDATGLREMKNVFVAVV